MSSGRRPLPSPPKKMSVSMKMKSGSKLSSPFRAAGLMSSTLRLQGAGSWRA
jgi:hypothetical protein